MSLEDTAGELCRPEEWLGLSKILTVMPETGQNLPFGQLQERPLTGSRNHGKAMHKQARGTERLSEPLERFRRASSITPFRFDVFARTFSQTFAIQHFSLELEIFADLHKKELAEIATPFH